MEKLGDFYILFIIITIILILALIGYFVSMKRKKEVKFKINEEENFVTPENPNVSLQEMLNNNKGNQN